MPGGERNREVNRRAIASPAPPLMLRRASKRAYTDSLATPSLPHEPDPGDPRS
jgi:hypothetical protein